MKVYRERITRVQAQQWKGDLADFLREIDDEECYRFWIECLINLDVTIGEDDSLIIKDKRSGEVWHEIKKYNYVVYTIANGGVAYKIYNETQFENKYEMIGVN